MHYHSGVFCHLYRTYLFGRYRMEAQNFLWSPSMCWRVPSLAVRGSWAAVGRHRAGGEWKERRGPGGDGGKRLQKPTTNRLSWSDGTYAVTSNWKERKKVSTKKLYERKGKKEKFVRDVGVKTCSEKNKSKKKNHYNKPSCRLNKHLCQECNFKKKRIKNSQRCHCQKFIFFSCSSDLVIILLQSVNKSFFFLMYWDKEQV